MKNLSSKKSRSTPQIEKVLVEREGGEVIVVVECDKRWRQQQILHGEGGKGGRGYFPTSLPTTPLGGCRVIHLDFVSIRPYTYQKTSAKEILFFPIQHMIDLQVKLLYIYLGRVYLNKLIPPQNMICSKIIPDLNKLRLYTKSSRSKNISGDKVSWYLMMT